MLFIDGHDLTFTAQPDGTHKVVFDVLALTFGDNGQVIDSLSRTHTLTVRAGTDIAKVIKNGLVYDINVPLKKAGAYQLRVSLRDAATERVGSASQFIEAPDLKKGRLTLSGLAAAGVTPARAATTANASNDPGDELRDPEATPAVRRFHSGMYLDYGYWIYNAKLDKATKQPQLITQTKLFQDGKEIFVGPARPYEVGAQTDLKRLVSGGRIVLGNTLKPGEYVLQVIVTDALAKDKRRVATQWTDFELVK